MSCFHMHEAAWDVQVPPFDSSLGGITIMTLMQQVEEVSHIFC